MPGLPVFRYHLDPLASGSVHASPTVCLCCGDARGYIYTGPVYSEVELADALCPWCIADGSAHARFDATFVDSEAPDGEITDAQMVMLTQRTPGFAAWQSERWLSCCDELAAFVGPVGHAEISTQYPRLEGPLMTHIVHELEISGGAAQRLLASLHKDTAPTAFAFRCLRCETMLAYIDRD
jgi:uncharacterized protein CbrC (UPF0167 family)